jgi:hypothetical protein
MKEFVRLAKARKEREFFEKLTDAELDTFAKALKMKPSDSREKKLAEVIAYSKKKKVSAYSYQLQYYRCGGTANGCIFVFSCKEARRGEENYR